MLTLRDSQDNNYVLKINRLPGVSFKCQRVSMPGLRIATSSPDNPKQLITLPMSTFEFDNFSCKFLVDDDLTNWKSVVDWFKQGTSDDDIDNVFSDFTVLIPSLYGKPSLAVRYIDAFPISLSPYELSSTNAGGDVSCDMTMAYQDFVIEQG